MNWRLKLIRLFEPKCDYCKQVACRCVSAVYYCMNKKCQSEAMKDKGNYIGATVDVPLDSTGWKHNKNHHL